MIGDIIEKKECPICKKVYINQIDIKYIELFGKCPKCSGLNN